MRRIIARELAEAIRDGFGTATVSRRGFEYRVHVDGFSEPIVIRRSEVTLPDWAEPFAPGIDLDIRAILSS